MSNALKPSVLKGLVFLLALWFGYTIYDFGFSPPKPVVVKGLMEGGNIHFPSWFNRQNWSAPEILDQLDPPDYIVMQKDIVEFGDRADDQEEVISMRDYFSGYRNGLVLELGAMDGWRINVSKRMERLFGWRSILIEANPKLSEQLPLKRPNALSIEAAICSSPQTLHFSPKDGAGIIVELTTASHIKTYHKALLDENGKFIEAKLAQLRKVRCIPLGALLAELGVTHLNFFILDVEGGELSVLESLDFDKLSVDVLAIETKRRTGNETEQSIVDFMATRPEYEITERRLGRNTWFKHRDFIPSKAAVVTL